MNSERFERGLNTLRKIDPEIAANLMEMMKDVAPDLARWTIEFGFGDIMSRPGLDLKIRELVNIGMLGAMGTASDQLKLHVKGALNTGAKRAEILEDLGITAQKISRDIVEWSSTVEEMQFPAHENADHKQTR